MAKPDLNVAIQTVAGAGIPPSDAKASLIQALQAEAGRQSNISALIDYLETPRIKSHRITIGPDGKQQEIIEYE